MDTKVDLIGMTANVVSSYVSNNTVAAADLPDLIQEIHDALLKTHVGNMDSGKMLVPAVPIEESITPDHIVCLEDGKTFKSLKRHLTSQYDMSPEQYRSRWGLPPDYPMVAPNYAKARSDLAKKLGLGRKADEGAEEVPD